MLEKGSTAHEFMKGCELGDFDMPPLPTVKFISITPKCTVIRKSRNKR